jgi:hypothetical protein
LKKTKVIKTQAVLSLLRTSNRYLTVAIYSLQDEIMKEDPDRELVCVLCDYIASINRIISYFTVLIEPVEGESFEIGHPQALIAKTCMNNFKKLKTLLHNEFGIFVELN